MKCYWDIKNLVDNRVWIYHPPATNFYVVNGTLKVIDNPPLSKFSESIKYTSTSIPLAEFDSEEEAILWIDMHNLVRI